MSNKYIVFHEKEESLCPLVVLNHPVEEAPVEEAGIAVPRNPRRRPAALCLAPADRPGITGDASGAACTW